MSNVIGRTSLKNLHDLEVRDKLRETLWGDKNGGEKLTEAGKRFVDNFSVRDQFLECAEVGLNFGANWSEAPMVTGSFPIITGEILSAPMIEKYKRSTAALEKIVENVPVSKSSGIAPGLTDFRFPREVVEDGEYQSVYNAEKYVTYGTTKYGMTVSVTQEMVKEDRTGELLRNMTGISEACAGRKNRLVLEGMTDATVGGSYVVYRPAGVAEAIYDSARTGQDVATTTSGVGAINTSNLGGAIERLSLMKNDADGEDGDKDIIDILGAGMATLVCHPSLLAYCLTTCRAK